MTRRRYQPLTVDGAEGNGTPAVSDLVTVQGFLSAALDSFRLDMGRRFERLEDNVKAELLQGRTDHHLEHEALATSITTWETAQERKCAEQMAPYATMGQLFRVAGWVNCHRKWAIAAVSGALTAVAILGGLLLPGR